MFASTEINIMNEFLEEEEKRLQSDEGDTLVINLGIVEDQIEVRIGANISEEEKEEFTQILNEYVGVFVWSYVDMPGLNSDIVMHEIITKLEFRLIKQKLQKLIPEWSLTVKEEVMK